MKAVLFQSCQILMATSFADEVRLSISKKNTPPGFITR